MANKAVVRAFHTMTRAEFEKIVGVGFVPTPKAQGVRSNGQWATYKAASQKVQERRDCFCQRLIKGGAVYSGKTWSELAQAMVNAIPSLAPAAEAPGEEVPA